MIEQCAGSGQEAVLKASAAFDNQPIAYCPCCDWPVSTWATAAETNATNRMVLRVSNHSTSPVIRRTAFTGVIPNEDIYRVSKFEGGAYGLTDWWFRIFGRGLSLRDHRKYPPLFTERYNGTHGIKPQRYIHLGPFCLHLLKGPGR